MRRRRPRCTHRLIAALDLTPRQRQAALLYYGHKLRVQDVASEMGYDGSEPHTRVVALLLRVRAKYPNLKREYHRRDFDPFADAP